MTLNRGEGGGQGVVPKTVISYKMLQRKIGALLTNLPTNTQHALLHYARSVSEEPENQAISFSTVLVLLQK